jgi:hypothetical protein
MKSILPVVILSSIIWFASGCYYDSEELLFPQTDPSCDTINITYALSVAPILQENCLLCHSNSMAAGFGGNLRLEDYADVKIRVDDDKLLGAISHASGYSPMPMDASKLDPCKIKTISLWINAGAPDN